MLPSIGTVKTALYTIAILALLNRVAMVKSLISGNGM
jgi:hypothetical protein